MDEECLCDLAKSLKRLPTLDSLNLSCMLLNSLSFVFLCISLPGEWLSVCFQFKMLESAPMTSLCQQSADWIPPDRNFAVWTRDSRQTLLISRSLFFLLSLLALEFEITRG